MDERGMREMIESGKITAEEAAEIDRLLAELDMPSGELDEPSTEELLADDPHRRRGGDRR